MLTQTEQSGTKYVLLYMFKTQKNRFYILNVVLRIILLFFKFVDTKPKRKGMIVS